MSITVILLQTGLYRIDQNQTKKWTKTTKEKTASTNLLFQVPTKLESQEEFTATHADDLIILTSSLRCMHASAFARPQKRIHLAAAVVLLSWSSVLECAIEHPSFLPPPPPTVACSSFAQKLLACRRLSRIRLTTLATSSLSSNTRSFLIRSDSLPPPRPPAATISRWNRAAHGLLDPDAADDEASLDASLDDEQQDDASSSSPRTTDGSDADADAEADVRWDRRSRRQGAQTPAPPPPPPPRCRCRRHLAPSAALFFLPIAMPRILGCRSICRPRARLLLSAHPLVQQLGDVAVWGRVHIYAGGWARARGELRGCCTCTRVVAGLQCDPGWWCRWTFSRVALAPRLGWLPGCGRGAGAVWSGSWLGPGWRRVRAYGGGLFHVFDENRSKIGRFWEGGF